MIEFNSIMIILVAAILITLVSLKMRFPYTVSLMFLGLAVTFLRLQFPNLNIFGDYESLFSEDIFFGILLPPLIYEAALNLNYYNLKARIYIILFLVFIGVTVTTILTGYLVSAVSSFPLIFSFLMAAILSPTDPSGVISMIRGLDVPEELSTIVESESIVNDAIGIVAFSVVLRVIRSIDRSNSLCCCCIWLLSLGNRPWIVRHNHDRRNSHNNWNLDINKGDE